MASIFHIPSGVFPDGITFGDGTKMTTAATGGGGGGGSTTLDNAYPPTSSSTTSAPTSLVAKQIYQTASGALPLSGGTMTGTLVLPTSGAPITGDASGLDFSNGNNFGTATSAQLRIGSVSGVTNIGTNTTTATGTVNISSLNPLSTPANPSRLNLAVTTGAGTSIVNLGTGVTTGSCSVNIGNTPGASTTTVSIGSATGGAVTILGSTYATPDKTSSFGTGLGTTTGVTLGTSTTTTKTTIYGLEDSSPLNAAYVGASSTSNAPTVNNLNKTNQAVAELQMVVGQLAGVTIGGGTLLTAGTVVTALADGASTSSALQKSGGTMTGQLVLAATGIVGSGSGLTSVGSSGQTFTLQGIQNPMNMSFALSDEVTALATTNSVNFRSPFGFTIRSVLFMIGSFGTSGTVTFDILKNGSTIFSSGPSIPFQASPTGAQYTSAANPGTISSGTVSQYDLLTFKVSGTGAGTWTGAKCFITYY